MNFKPAGRRTLKQYLDVVVWILPNQCLRTAKSDDKWKQQKRPKVKDA